MYLRSDERELGKENFHAAVGSKPVRREFLQKGLRQGLTLRSGLSGYYFKYEKVTEPLRVGVIGTGEQGRRLIAAVNPDFIAVKSIADLRPSNQKKATEALESAAKVAEVKVYGRYQELLGKAKDDGLEAVVIALPSHLHAPVALAAMDAGLHVFTETPMALSVADAKKMARTAKDKKVFLAVGNQRRYSLLYDNALEIVRKGLLEDIHYIRAQWHLKKDEESAGEEGDQAKKPAKKDDKKIDWWRTVPKEDKEVKVKDHGYASVEELVRWQLQEKFSGGMLMELGYHLFDAATLLMAATPNRSPDQDYPMSVTASASQLAPNAEGDIDDHVYCMFEYPVKGYVDKGPKKARKKIGLQYDLIIGNEFDGYGETVLGKVGSLALEREQDGLLYRTSDTDKKLRVLTVQRKDKDNKPAPDRHVLDVPKDAPKAGDEESANIGQAALLGADAGFVAELEHWAWCVRNPAAENKPRCDAVAGLAATVLAVAAAQAVRTGNRIDFQKEWFDPDSDKVPEVDKNVKLT
jgi:predicted dehydrogenase